MFHSKRDGYSFCCIMQIDKAIALSCAMVFMLFISVQRHLTELIKCGLSFCFLKCQIAVWSQNWIFEIICRLSRLYPIVKYHCVLLFILLFGADFDSPPDVVSILFFCVRKCVLRMHALHHQQITMLSAASPLSAPCQSQLLQTNAINLVVHPSLHHCHHC